MKSSFKETVSSLEIEIESTYTIDDIYHKQA